MQYLKWVLILVALAILAGALGATAVEHGLASILWIGFVIAIVLAIVSFVMGKKVV